MHHVTMASAASAVVLLLLVQPASGQTEEEMTCYDLDQDDCEDSLYCRTYQNRCYPILSCTNLDQHWCSKVGNLCGGWHWSITEKRCRGCEYRDRNFRRQCQSFNKWGNFAISAYPGNPSSGRYPIGICDKHYCLGRDKRDSPRRGGGSRWQPQSCQCDCKGNWEGEHCERCPSQFKGDDCDECIRAGGGSTAATCKPCDINKDCVAENTVSISTVDKPSPCECKCKGMFKGSKCETCPPQFSGRSCDSCAANVLNDYPACTACSSAVHCSDNAASVAVNSAKNACVCTCNIGIAGPTCNVCAAGYIGTPATGCVQCTVGVHCLSRAQSVVDVNHQKCVCQNCNVPYDGDTCATCDSAGTMHVDKTTCTTCKSGYVGFPNCRQCTVAADCSNHAKSVRAVGDACQCACDNSWTGQKCDVCSGLGFDANCQYCRPGFFGPTCAECSVAGHCSSHATAVTSAAPFDSCSCTCTAKWKNSDCSRCPGRYKQSTCDACRTGRNGYIGYPACSTRCTSAAHCSSRATSVVSTGTACTCTCRNKWEGPTCATCPAIYGGQDCNECAPGRVNFPTCGDCAGVTCSGHGTAAADAKGDRCVCTCENSWTGDACETCPSLFKGAECKECANIGTTYPVCTGCTVAGHCNGRATTVVEAPPGVCTCTCTNFWEGTSCQECNSPHAGADCDDCATGHVKVAGTPASCRECTGSADCNGHATSVLSNGGACTCVCSGQWSGATCNTCPAQFDQGTCDSCAAGRILYPDCTTCTSICGPNAATALPNAATTQCTCTCKAQWMGDLCDMCAPKYDAAAGCAACAAGRAGYPACETCSTDVHCSGHATAVAVVGDACTCTCRNNWSQAACDVCAVPFGGDDCDACAPNHAGYPACVRCDVATHCKNGATAVSATGHEESCQCTCAGQWTGHDCSSCEAIYTATCDACVPNHYDYPRCIPCSTETHCNGRGVAVSMTATTCVCECVNPWGGDDCLGCGPKYRGDACDACAPGLFGHPACAPCSELCGKGGNGTVDAATGSCVCECRDGYEGALCDQCAEGFVHNVRRECELVPPQELERLPKTPSPPVEEKPSLIPRDNVHKGIAVAGGALGALSGPSMGIAAGRHAVFASLCNGASEQVLDPEITPLGLNVGGGRWGNVVGGLLGNLILIAVPVMLQLVSVYIRTRLRRRTQASFSFDREKTREEMGEAAAYMRFPYLSLFVVVFVYHGVATCAMKLIMFSDGVYRVIGIVTIIGFNIGFVGLIFYNNTTLGSDITFCTDEGDHSNLASYFFFGPGEWVSTTQGKRVRSWGLLFEMYRAGWTWFLIAECMILLVITAVQVWEAQEIRSCKILAGALTAFFGLYGLVILVARPWASPWDNISFACLVLLEAVAMGFLTRAFSEALLVRHLGSREMFRVLGASGSYKAAGKLLEVVTFITIVKGAFDACLLFYVEWTRRNGVQASYNSHHDGVDGVLANGDEDEDDGVPSCEFSSLRTAGRLGQGSACAVDDGLEMTSVYGDCDDGTYNGNAAFDYSRCAESPSSGGNGGTVNTGRSRGRSRSAGDAYTDDDDDDPTSPGVEIRSPPGGGAPSSVAAAIAAARANGDLSKHRQASCPLLPGAAAASSLMSPRLSSAHSSSSPPASGLSTTFVVPLRDAASSVGAGTGGAAAAADDSGAQFTPVKIRSAYLDRGSARASGTYAATTCATASVLSSDDGTPTLSESDAGRRPARSILGGTGGGGGGGGGGAASTRGSGTVNQSLSTLFPPASLALASGGGGSSGGGSTVLRPTGSSSMRVSGSAPMMQLPHAVAPRHSSLHEGGGNSRVLL